MWNVPNDNLHGLFLPAFSRRKSIAQPDRRSCLLSHTHLKQLNDRLSRVQVSKKNRMSSEVVFGDSGQRSDPDVNVLIAALVAFSKRDVDVEPLSHWSHGKPRMLPLHRRAEVWDLFARPTQSSEHAKERIQVSDNAPPQRLPGQSAYNGVANCT